MLNAHALHRGNREIASHLGPAESSVDETIATQATLVALAINTRIAAGLPASVGHDAIGHMLEALSASYRSRGAMLAAHEAFVGLREDLRLPLMEGSGGGCPPGDTKAHLAAVQTA